MRFACFFLLASLAVSSLAVTLSDLQTHITTISSCLTTLQDIKQKHTEDHGFLEALDFSGKILEAHKLHTQATKITSALDEATVALKTVEPSQLSGDDVQSLYTSVEAMQPIVISGLNLMVDRKDHPILKSLPGARGFVRRDVAMVGTSANAFGNALMTLLPESLSAEGAATKRKIDEAFASAIAAY